MKKVENVSRMYRTGDVKKVGPSDMIESVFGERNRVVEEAISVGEELG